MSEWISVKDRMPTPISFVLIATNFDTKPWMAYYTNEWYILSLEGNGPQSEFKSNLVITHWCELPELPPSPPNTETEPTSLNTTER